MKFQFEVEDHPGVGITTDVRVPKGVTPATEPVVIIMKSGNKLKGTLPTEQLLRERVLKDVATDASWFWEDEISQVVPQ